MNLHWPKERLRLDTGKKLVPVLLGACRGPNKMGSFLWQLPEKTEDGIPPQSEMQSVC